jgi:hypothetical protein
MFQATKVGKSLLEGGYFVSQDKPSTLTDPLHGLQHRRPNHLPLGFEIIQQNALFHPILDLSKRSGCTPIARS